MLCTLGYLSEVFFRNKFFYTNALKNELNPYNYNEIFNRYFSFFFITVSWLLNIIRTNTKMVYILKNTGLSAYTFIDTLHIYIYSL